jgi:hydroxypyruvate isomerase
MSNLSRREALLAATAVLAAPLAASAQAVASPAPSPAALGRAVRKGRLKQSVSRWCYKTIPPREFYKAVADLGLPAVDLLEESEWPIVREYGLVCSMGYGGGGTISDGLNVKANHDAIATGLLASIPRAAKLGVPNLITFFGNRRGMSDADALANCVAGLNRVKAAAEEHGITICVELLNSRVNHADYQGDRTSFGLDVVKAVGSPRVKLLYDIYHMQIMEGDIIATIRKNQEWIAHYHTGGVPGRHELDDTQELNWAAVCRAIVDTGFTGYVAHEFVPVRDPLTSLREAVVLCDV